MTLRTIHQQRLDKLPPDWHQVTVGALGYVVGGSTPSRGVSAFWGGPYSWLTPGELTGLSTKYVFSTRETITRAGLDSCGTRLLPLGALVVTSRATLGNVALAGLPLCTNQGFKSVVLNATASPDFYFHLFKILTGELERRASGTTFLEISGREFSSVVVPNPPLLEQRQIAHILDTVDDAIRKTEQIIAKLKQVKQGLLHDLLTRGIDDNGELRDPDGHPEQFKESPLGRIPRTWQVNRLESLTSRRIVDGVHHTPTYVQHGVPFLTVENLSRGPGISLEPCRYVSPSAHSEYYRRADPRAGDVLVSKDGTLGIARIIPNDFPEVSIFVSIALLRPRRDCVLPELICEFFETASYMRQLAYQSAGTGLKHIHLEHFRAFVLPVPPLEEQRRIFAILGAAENRLAAERAALSALRATKHGLMEDLLTGRVRVTPLLSDAP